MALSIAIGAEFIDAYLYNFNEEIVYIFILILMSLRIFENLLKGYKYKVKLEESEEKYKRLFDNSAFGIYQSTFDENFLIINPS